MEEKAKKLTDCDKTGLRIQELAEEIASLLWTERPNTEVLPEYTIISDGVDWHIKAVYIYPTTKEG